MHLQVHANALRVVPRHSQNRRPAVHAHTHAYKHTAHHLHTEPWSLSPLADERMPLPKDAMLAIVGMMSGRGSLLRCSGTACLSSTHAGGGGDRCELRMVVHTIAV